MNIGITWHWFLPTIHCNKNFKILKIMILLNEACSPLTSKRSKIFQNFKGITGISERRYAKNNLNISNFGIFCGRKGYPPMLKLTKRIWDYIILHIFLVDGKPKADPRGTPFRV